MGRIARRQLIMLPLAAAGCAWVHRAAVVPMVVIRQRARAGQRAPVLVTMLPGAYSVPQDFIDQGFVAALRDRAFTVDVRLADAHQGYVEDGTLLERLRDDVLLPAQTEGYRRIWLVGTSLGGLASLALLMKHGDLIEGVVAIAPYLGRPALLQQVAAAGGAQPFADAARSGDDPEAALWSWLGHAGAAQRDKIHLYTGASDRFIAGHRLLAMLLTEDHVVELAGGHDWPVWKALWQRWLARAPWPRDPGLQG